MKLVYVYAGFSLAVAVYFLYLTVTGLRTPDIPVGAYWVNLFDLVVIAFILFTFLVVYKLRET